MNFKNSISRFSDSPLWVHGRCTFINMATNNSRTGVLVHVQQLHMLTLYYITSLVKNVGMCTTSKIAPLLWHEVQFCSKHHQKATYLHTKIHRAAPLTDYKRKLMDSEENPQTMQEAKDMYLNYSKKRVPPSVHLRKKFPSRKVVISEKIKRRVQSGEALASILKDYPSQMKVIRDFKVLKPPKDYPTNTYFIYGPQGSGKSAAVQATLNYIKEKFNVPYYKQVGFSKFLSSGYLDEEI